MKLEGILQKNGTVILNNVEYLLPVRGTDKNGYLEVLMDATNVGGSGFMHRQSIQPYIGMKVSFYCNKIPYGYNYEILKRCEKNE